MARLFSQLGRWLLVALALAACDAERPAAPVPSGTSPTTIASASSTAIPSSTVAKGDGEAAGVAHLVRYTGGATADETLPLVVAIHGLGDQPSRFGLLDGFTGKARVILPRGLSPYLDGYSWFDIQVRGERDVNAVARGLQEASDKLGAMIAALRERHPTRGKAIVTGFSQGGMLSFALAVRHPELIAVAVPVAGWLPAPLLPTEKPPDDAPLIVALHGVDDGVLALEPTRESVAKLRGGGWKAELVEYPGVGHSVSGHMRRELYRRLAEATR